jgi:hypothetical protein
VGVLAGEDMRGVSSSALLGLLAVILASPGNNLGRKGRMNDLDYSSLQIKPDRPRLRISPFVLTASMNERQTRSCSNLISVVPVFGLEGSSLSGGRRQEN